MILRRLTIIITFLTAWVWSNGQQINAVPDYVFRNQMSVGRNAVTDTAAYFSIGPRYGANKGFMPPIVGDTATFSSGKRNGLLIFSVQKNKFLYWDSVRVQWSDMAGSSGSYIVAGDTASMLTPYVRHAGYGLTKSSQSFLVDTLNIATRAWRQKGLDSLAALEVSGSGTTNYVPKFTASTTIGNSIIFDNATNVGIGTASPSARLHIVGAELRVQNDNALYSFRNAAGTRTGYLQARADAFDIWNDQAVPMVFGTNNTERLRITSDGDILHRGTYNPLSAANRGNIMLNGSASNIIGFSNNSALRGYIFHTDSDFQFYNNTTGGRVGLYTEATARLWIQANGRVGINTTTDAGYQLDINGTLRSVNGANFATNGTSHIGMGTVPSAWSWPNGVTQFRFGGHIAVADNSFLQLGTNSYYDGSNYVRVNAGYASRYLQNDGGHFWSTAITSTAGSTVTFNEQMRMTRDGELLINTTSDAGDYKLQVAGNILTNVIYTRNNTDALIFGTNSAVNPYIQGGSNNHLYFGTSNTPRLQITTDGELLVNTSTDAGDYKLQVVGNARVGTGKLDIVTNTAFGLSLSRSGTDVVAQQINNSTGILYYGAESSTGGALFTGSSAYAAVIGSGANYPLQFASNNITRATLNTNGELQIGSTSDVGDYKLQVIGNGYFGGSITTNAPDGGNAKPWKLGSVIATTVILDTANYVEVEINGVAYKLALVIPN